MAQPAVEKAPLDWTELEGLELDTRAKDEREKQLDTYVTSPMSAATGNFDWGDEKSMLARREAQELRPLRVLPSIHENRSPISPSDRPCSGSDGIEAVVPPSRPRVQRICGLKRRNFFIMYGTILGILVLAAVIGGVIGGTRKSPVVSFSGSGSTPETPLSSDLSDANSSVNANLPPNDIMVGSPIIPVAYSSTTPEQQAYRLYYQAANGDIKQIQYNESQGEWSQAQPIFTDAMNNTGLAAFTFRNHTNSHQQISIFYVESNGFIAEKRNFELDFFDLGTNTFNQHNVLAIGDIPAGATGGPKPENHWDSFRMTATYSTNFPGGPQGRLFIHQRNINGSYVQEWIWNQTTDAWALGQQLNDALPGSHMAAIVDESSKTLRLFYAATNLTLLERTLNISDPNAIYEQGIKIPDFLASVDSDIAAIATADATLLYYYTNSAIYEVAVTSQQPIGSHPAPSFVVSPNITVNRTQSSIYEPLGAVLGSADQKTNVFWAEQVVAATSGYGALMYKNKDLDEGSWNSTNSLSIPLGT